MLGPRKAAQQDQTDGLARTASGVPLKARPPKVPTKSYNMPAQKMHTMSSTSVFVEGKQNRGSSAKPSGKNHLQIVISPKRATNSAPSVTPLCQSVSPEIECPLSPYPQ
jgi:hypothetical protein